MTINLNKHKDELLFLPLGGSGEIGMNMNLYQYKGKWIMVDFGAGFADDYLPGVDMIVPNISFLTKNNIRPEALILTHVHEDHLGAVQYLWPLIKCPIYCTPFTAAFLKVRLKEMDFAREVKIIEVECGGKINLDPFFIEMVPLNHSTPEMHALVIKTELGNVLHTGDWKFDHDPLIGDANDEELLRKYGDEGVLAMIGDSTNVFNPGVSGSEGDLRVSLTELIGKCKNMVAVTTFASNVARLETVIKAAEQCGRKVVVAGKSLHRIIAAAQSSGYLKDIAPFLSDTQITKYPRDQILLLCTGCQGEPLAATAKIANKSHPTVRFAPGDNIIFSSKIIPGNEKRIYRLFNHFVQMGIEVYTEKDHFVHVSGHPAVQELELMYKLVRPKISIPVHGEHVHMHEHVRLAKEWGVEHAVQVNNGDILRIAPNEPMKLAVAESGYLAVDGNCLIPPNSQIMKMRRKMQNDGIIVITIILDNRDRLACNPIISTPGVIDEVEDKELIHEIQDEITIAVEEYAKNNKGKKFSDEGMAQVIRSAVRKIVRREVGKEPLINLNIEYTDR